MIYYKWDYNKFTVECNVHHMRAAAAPGGLSVDIDLLTGDYKVKVKNQDWLQSQDTFVTLNGHVSFYILY